VRDLLDEKGTAQGYCVITDKTNDQAFLVWRGTIDPTTGFNGDYQWTGGTGKYRGMTGNNTFRLSDSIGEIFYAGESPHSI